MPSEKKVKLQQSPVLDDKLLVYQEDGCLMETGKIVNASGKKLFCRYWKPISETPRALVCVVHGFAEHLQWYDPLCRRLAKSGCIAFGHDNVGHGQSEGTRVYIEKFDDYVRDVGQHCDLVQSQYPGLPMYVVGHSMGGLITLEAIIESPNRFKGAVVVGPLVALNAAEATQFRQMVAKTLCYVLPQMQLAKLKVEMITRDTDMQNKLQNDPLFWHGGLKLRLAVAIMRALDQMVPRLSTIDVPILILHGELDKLCDLNGSKLLYEQCASKDKEFKIFQNAEHNLYNELPDVREEAISDTVNWLSSRIPV